MLSLATFATTDNGFCSVDSLVTYDKRMINHWQHQQGTIETRFYAMRSNLTAPFATAKLPQVIHPHQVG